MRRNGYSGLFIGVVIGVASNLAAPVQAQVDLAFQFDVTPEYADYLDQKEAELAGLIDGGEGEDADRMALVLVKLAQVHRQADATADRIEPAGEDIQQQLEELGDVIGGEMDEVDADTPEGLLQSLRQRFVEERSAQFDDDVEVILDNLENDGTEIEEALRDFGDAVEQHMEDVPSLMEDLSESDAPFAVTFTWIAGPFDETHVFEVNRGNLDDVQTYVDAIAAAGEELGNALDLLDQVEVAGNNDAAIAALRAALAQLDLALEIIETAVEKQPLSTFAEEFGAIDGIGGAAGALREVVADVDAILAGRTFEAGEMVVRPVALIENRTEEAWLSADFVQGAMVLSLMAVQQFDTAN